MSGNSTLFLTGHWSFGAAALLHSLLQRITLRRALGTAQYENTLIYGDITLGQHGATNL